WDPNIKIPQSFYRIEMRLRNECGEEFSLAKKLRVACCTAKGSPTEELLLDTGLTMPDKLTSVRTYPNPFSSNVTIAFSLSEDSPIQIEVYNLLGQRVYQKENLIEGGTHTVRLHELANAPAGIYTYFIRAGSEQVSGKMMKSNLEK
ncbi:MAG: T9SS type A sorting domain-containing protein, partial [Bacteroidota bacterium]